jgi:hypothetical protein
MASLVEVLSNSCGGTRGRRGWAQSADAQALASRSWSCSNVGPPFGQTACVRRPPLQPSLRTKKETAERRWRRTTTACQRPPCNACNECPAMRASRLDGMACRSCLRPRLPALAQLIWIPPEFGAYGACGSVERFPSDLCAFLVWTRTLRLRKTDWGPIKAAWAHSCSHSCLRQQPPFAYVART